jgi:hypothetical protein
MSPPENYAYAVPLRMTAARERKRRPAVLDAQVAGKGARFSRE